MNYNSFIPDILDIARKAGEIIMRHYGDDIEITIKKDKSPVTEADIAANTYIVSRLADIAPDVQIIAEESENSIDIETRFFWLVDPLDGTKSYIKHTGEFTVNIALIEDNKPVLGVIYVPVTKEMYFTGDDGKTYKKSYKSEQSEAESIAAREPSDDGLSVIASLSHRSPETDEYINALNVKEIVSASSSLKFCLLAEGKADIYPRFGLTMEWDTAAGHAILNAAGGSVTKTDGSPFLYGGKRAGKKDFLNPFFIASGRN